MNFAGLRELVEVERALMKKVVLTKLDVGTKAVETEFIAGNVMRLEGRRT